MKIHDLFEGKGTKEQAGYIPRPKNGEKCINCTMWRDPNKCSAVAGDISPNGWCEWYAGGAYGKRGKRVDEAEGLGLTIFDIDDTLFRTTAQIKVVKDGQIVRSLNNQEFNTYQLQPGESFDFGEFRNAEKFNRESIPIEPMIAKLKAIINNAGDSKVIMLTARSDFDNKELFLDTFRKHGIDMSRVHVHRAGNLGGSPSQNKAVWIRKYLDTGKYARVRLYDDAMSNIRMFIGLQSEYPDIKFFPYFVTHEGSIKTIKEDGRIVRGVNTTVDVGPNEIKTQAAKFGNTVDRDGRPPSMSTNVKGKSTNVHFNLGMVKEDKEPRYTAKEWAIIEGGHSLDDLDKPTPTIAELVAMHGVPAKVILDQLTQGIQAEYEHTSDFEVAKQIAMDHLGEDPYYYDKLKFIENFADGKKKGKSRPGRVKKSGASCNGSVTDLRARAKKYSGERGRMYHWCANMKSGRKKS